MARPALHWEYVLSWAQDNKVTDEAVISDDNGAEVTGVHRNDGLGRLYLGTSYGATRRAFTWGRLKEVALAAGAQAGDLLIFDGGRLSDDVKVVDIGLVEDGDDGHDHLVLQRRWG